jgi:sugar/nucleoside kinase (ribokinase family)
MTRYHVYGLGNALVDIEFELAPERLQALEIEKGVMTLIDETRQHQVLEQLQDLPTKRSCGGSAANTIIAVSQLGGKAFYSCKVADDEAGQFYAQDLVNCGVDSNLQQQQPEAGVTGKCLVMVTPDADRTMNTFLGISASFSGGELMPDAISEADYTYLEGYLVTGDASKAAAIQARELATNAGRKTAFTLSDPNMVKFFKQGLLEIIGPGVDFLFANDSEALEMAGTEDITQAIDYLKTLAKAFAITRGGEGSLIFDGENLLEIAPVPVQAIDTVGAGDMYAGALLYGITQGMDYAIAGRLASLTSAQLVTQYGPRMATPDLLALRAQVNP